MDLKKKTTEIVESAISARRTGKISYDNSDDNRSDDFARNDNSNAYFDDGDSDGYDDFEYDEGIDVEPFRPEVASTTVSENFFSRKAITDPSFSTDADIFQQLCVGAGIRKPSRIQALTWPVLLQGQSSIVADQTGSGKTLIIYYLLFSAYCYLQRRQTRKYTDLLKFSS